MISVQNKKRYGKEFEDIRGRTQGDGGICDCEGITAAGLYEYYHEDTSGTGFDEARSGGEVLCRGPVLLLEDARQRGAAGRPGYRQVLRRGF